MANRYISLSPAPGSSRELDDGAVLRLADTTSVVDLDQLFNTFDEKTRKGLRDTIRGFATQYEGKGAEANASAKYFNPFLSTSRRVFGELAQDEGALTDFLVNSSTAVTALAERRDDLSALVGNANATTKAIGDQNAALDRALALLPTTLRRGSSTFVNLRATLDDLDVAGGGVQARDARADPLPARAAPARPRTPGRRSATCARSCAARGPTTTPSS